jgi:anti-sigma factor ChrR (cupin superfamily)
MDLSRIPFKETSYEGVWIHFLHSDRGTGHAAVLIKMAPGCSYPKHRHKGAEELFILQGGYRDELGEYRAGEYVRYEDGSAHHPVALEDESEDCVFFAISQEGIDLF